MQKLPTIISLNAVSALAQVAQVGIAYPLVVLWLTNKNVSTNEIGLVGSAQWAGMLLGILSAPHLMYACGARVIVIVGCVGSGLIALMMAWIPTQFIFLWAVASVTFGFGIGLRWIGNESWLYSIVSGTQRGRIVGVHETLIQLGQVVGPLLIAWQGIASAHIFYLTAAFAVVAVLPLFFATIQMQNAPHRKPVAIKVFLAEMRKRFKHNFGIRIGILSGIIDGALFGMLAVYEVGNGASIERAATVMTVFGIGGLIASVPFGWLSDRFGVSLASKVCAFMGIAGSLFLWLGSPWMVWSASFILGAVAACMLTLSIIAGIEQAARENKNMGAAISEISLVYTAGTVVGPILAGTAMDALGSWAFPALTLMLCCRILIVKSVAVVKS
jgi:MFS family permease